MCIYEGLTFGMGLGGLTLYFEEMDFEGSHEIPVCRVRHQDFRFEVGRSRSVASFHFNI